MVNTAKAGAINFEINSDLSALSWEAYDTHLPLDQLWEKYHAITSKPRLNAWLVWVLVGFANASFCRLFSGDWIAVAAVKKKTQNGNVPLISYRRVSLPAHLQFSRNTLDMIVENRCPDRPRPHYLYPPDHFGKDQPLPLDDKKVSARVSTSIKCI